MDNQELWAVTTTYSFDPTSTCKLFSSYDKAMKFIEKDAKREFAIDIEENKYDGILSISEEEGSASITLYFYDRNDITEWRISMVDKGVDFYEVEEQ